MRNWLKVFISIATLPFAAAQAAPVTFIHEGSGTGTLDNITFQTGFVITATADTDNIQSVNAAISFLDHDSASINILGVGTFDFVSPTRTYANRNIPEVGFSRATVSGTDLFDGPGGPVFSTYDLSTSIGPISGTAELLQWANPGVLTTGGTLFFSDFFTDGRFTAIVRQPDQVVPVPAAAFLFVPAIGGMMAMRRKKA